MDDLANLIDGSGGQGGTDPAAELSGLGQAFDGAGGLDGLLGQLRAGGLDEAVDSWVSTGPNAAVGPDQLGAALRARDRLAPVVGLRPRHRPAPAAAGGLWRQRRVTAALDPRREAGRPDRTTGRSRRMSMRPMRPRSDARAPPARHPAGMDTPTVAAARTRGFLEREPVVWLSTVRPDGTPHLVPIWFWWDGEALLVFSKPDAQKVRNLRAHPSVMLALGDAEEDFDVGLIEGRAELLDTPTRAVLPVAHLAKYAGQLAASGLDAETYAATYSQVIRIVPSGYLRWHGRTVPRSVRLAGAPVASLAEPRRTGGLGPSGEPVSRRRPPVRPRIVDPARVRPSTRGWRGDPLGRRLRGLVGDLGGLTPVGAA